MQQYNIPVDENLSDLLQKENYQTKMQQFIKSVGEYLRGIDEEKYELELRFGEFRGREEYFKSGVESQVFYRVLEHFNSDIYDKVPQDITLLTEEAEGSFEKDYPEIIVEKNYENDRKQRFREASLKGHSSTFYSMKTQKIRLDNTKFYSRFAVSSEQPLNALPPGLQQQALREKKRWSFAINKLLAEKSSFSHLKPFRVDLTHVSGWIIDTNGIKRNLNEYEIEMEVIQKPFNAEKELLPGLVFMLQLIQNTRYPISSDEYSNIVFLYNKYWFSEIQTLEQEKRRFNPKFYFDKRWKIYAPINKPVNFKLELLERPEKLAITDKADGQRKLMFILNDGVYLLYFPSEVIKFMGKGEPSLDNTILDGELVEINGVRNYLVFDILTYKGKDVRSLSFVERLKILKSISLPQGVQLKEFYFGGNFYDNVEKLFFAIAKKKYGNDGIIVNLIDDDYTKTVYKWKPPHLLTIDFNVEKLNGDTYKISVIDRKLEQFKGTVNNPFSGVIKTEMPLNTGQIVEMNWDGSTFVPLRIRHDRDIPNAKITAINIWKDIMHPIQETTIRGKDLVMLRYFHNNIKRSMIEDCGKGKYLLDIGSGRGGDLHKWKGSQLRVLAVEPSKENIGEFEKRLGETGYTFSNDEYTSGETRVRILNTVGEDSKLIVKTFYDTFGEKADCISIFNALTFFYKDEENLDALVETVSELLKVEGTFIGMVMDGAAVRKMMGSAKSIKQDSWEIKKMVDFTDEPYGNKIYINLVDTIVKDQEEYLVDFQALKDKLAEKGIFLARSEMLDSKVLSPSSEKLYNLYRIFQFKKHPIQPPAQRQVIQDTIVNKMNQLFIGMPVEHLKTLDEEERDPITLFGKNFVRVGLNSNCILTALARSVSQKYEMGRNTIVKPLTTKENSIRERYNELFYENIIAIIKEKFENGELLEHFEAWEQVKPHLDCDKLHYYPILNLIASVFKTNIIYIKYFDSVREPKIEKTETSFKKTALVQSHDNQFNTLAVEKNGVLTTTFDNDPFIL